jgi:hypothetical protein
MTQEVRHRRHCEHERTSGIDIPLLGNLDSGSLVLAWLGAPLAPRD